MKRGSHEPRFCYVRAMNRAPTLTLAGASHMPRAQRPAMTCRAVPLLHAADFTAGGFAQHGAVHAERIGPDLHGKRRLLDATALVLQTHSWEQRKLGELGSVAMCKRIYKEQTGETGDVPFFKIGTFGGEPDAFISRDLFEEYRNLYPFPKNGDVLISAAGTIGRTVVYQGECAYYQDSNIVWLDHDERLDNGFFLQYLNSQSWNSLEGSTLKRLYNKDILDASIALPPLAEQKAISGTLASLDNLITLHQRKCTWLRNRGVVLLGIMSASKKEEVA